MIKYKLTCKDCETIFDSWFAKSNEYYQQNTSLENNEIPSI